MINSSERQSSCGGFEILSGGMELLPRTMRLRKKLLAHHHSMSVHFKQDLEEARIANTESVLSQCAHDDGLLVVVAVPRETNTEVGYCIGLVKHDRVGDIYSIYVDEEQRRMGIAREMLKEALTWFEGKGVHDVEVQILYENETVAPMYKELGFRPWTIHYKLQNSD
jgi:ribosomal protein S18 acetylase RimI-like enzyme